jgi:hypothetical protein
MRRRIVVIVMAAAGFAAVGLVDATVASAAPITCPGGQTVTMLCLDQAMLGPGDQQAPGPAAGDAARPGIGRYSVTIRRTGAPRPADLLGGTLVLDVRQLVNKLFRLA